MQTTKIAGLDVRITGGVDREGGGDGPVVVLLHGFGAAGDDLVPLSRVLPVPREVRFVFPEAPLAPRELGGGRAWWPLDLVALQAERARGQRSDRSRQEPEGMAAAREHVIALLDGVEARLGVRGDQIVLGGFSQGAMLSCDLALRTDRALAGLALLSATLLCRQIWEPRMATRKGLPVFQSHGRRDELLPFEAAVELRDLLRVAGCALDWVEFNGGHEVPAPVLDGVSKLIAKCVAEKQLIYKICSRAEWDAAIAAGSYAGSADDARDGFIHFSTAEQVAATAAKYFAGRDDLVLVEVDAALLGSALRFEPSRDGALFPHLYGALPPNAVLSSRAYSVGSKIS